MQATTKGVDNGLDQSWLDDVAADVRNQIRDQATIDMLRVPELAPKRLKALLYLKSGVESQLAAQKGRLAKAAVDMDVDEWLPFRAEQMDWRGKAIRFLSAIEKDMLRVRQQLETTPTCCTTAIAEHKDQMYDMDPTWADEILWSHLDDHESRTTD